MNAASTVFQMTVSPDFPPKRMSGWFIFNTWLQKTLEQHIHLELYQDFDSQREAIAADRVDLIYANPFDASMLVRDKGFVPLVRAIGHADECLIAVRETATVHTVEDLQPGCRIASTDDPDVNLVGMIMLEPADLDSSNTQSVHAASYPLVAKSLLRDEADVGFFLEEAFHDLSNLVKSQLRPIVHSQISDISHVFLVGPRLADKRDAIRSVLMNMMTDPKGMAVLTELGFSAWKILNQEDTEFMIDLMDTLKA